MKLTIHQALQKAIEAHKGGKLQEAEGLYRAILQDQPNHPDANHNLGVLAVSVNKPEIAVPLFKTSLEANPSQGQFWMSYVNALINTNQLDSAKSVLEQGRIAGLAGDVLKALAAQLLPITLDIEINLLIEHYQKGRYNHAESLAKTITQQYPDNDFSWKVLGAVFKKTGRLKESLIANQRAAAISPNDPEAHSNLGITLQELGRFEDAENSYKIAIAIKPDFAEAHCNLGVTLQQLGRLKESETSYKNAIAIKPGYDSVHFNLGITLQQLGRLEEAEASYKKAIAIKPEHAESHGNLGVTLQELGRLKESEESQKKAIAIKPEYAHAHYNLGVSLQQLGQLAEAEASYKKAIAIRPEFAEAHFNLGLTFYELGRQEDALAAVIESIKRKPTVEAKRFFVEIVEKLDIKTWDHTLAQFVIDALLEPWGRQSDVMPIACRLLSVDKEFSQYLNHSKNKFSESISYGALLNSIFKKDFAASSLLSAMLSSSHIPDAGIEKFLTLMRGDLLKLATSEISIHIEADHVAPMYCYLAQQCFINEYVFFQTPEEINFSNNLLNQLTKALNDNQSIPAVWIISVACYFPLHSISGAVKLLQKSWLKEVAEVLKQQIQEPLEEFNLRSSIPVLTDIENKVSLAVQSQYEESPYPRWMNLPKDSNEQFLNSYLQSKFPLSPYKRLVDDKNLRILVAGCGTGQHPIGSAQLIKGARLLAIDLSMASLAYAKRKTAELGIESIEYAQADILKLSTLGMTFDVIESAGVLHHLESPLEGWETLLSLLSSNGIMRLGFYSELARRDIVRVRNLIAKDNIGSSPQVIRDYRNYLLQFQCSDSFGFATTSSDFFSTSACRDFLFHVQEHRMSLSILSNFIKEQSLQFLGFDMDRSIIRTYKSRFPNDPSATNLEQWSIYEEDNPNTFINMYQFWIQRKC
jgi:tetratricopeptide (TPR) repeat protein/2-polyprenyl-3-methyl-5-hydroxy-6-metoxy-1,4-benzoquinol methylase